jgi:hypothetical protein
MRLPIRSESDAFRAVFVVAVVVVVCLALGYWVTAGLGVGLAAVAVAALSAWMLADRSREGALRAAEAAGARSTKPRLTLLIANEAPSREQFERDILPRLGSHPTLEIHAPVLQSRTHFVTTDIDHERALARRRLEAVLRAARDTGVPAAGRVGDPIDPLIGVEDELRRFAASDVIVTIGGEPDDNWVEAELLRELSAALDKPVMPIVVDHKSA